MNRLIIAWRVLMGTPMYTDAEEMAQTQRQAKEILAEFGEYMRAMREFVPLFHTHQEFLKLNEEVRRLAVFIRQNYAQEIQSGQHQTMSTVFDVAVHYMTCELERQGRTAIERPSPKREGVVQ